ncbi:MAG: SDR family oxidoreductase [Acidimicrobiia bacterium]|nr:SDR family oxidoreductase [Acidimicrobiia bacterium]
MFHGALQPRSRRSDGRARGGRRPFDARRRGPGRDRHRRRAGDRARDGPPPRQGGARIVVAEWKPDRMQRTVDELTALGVPTLGVVCDVSRKDRIDAMVAATVERFGRVDALVNNAQTFRPGATIAEVSEEDVEVFHRSGVLGTLWAMQAVFPTCGRAGGAASSTSPRRWGSPGAGASPPTTRRRSPSGP